MLVEEYEAEPRVLIAQTGGRALLDRSPVSVPLMPEVDAQSAGLQNEAGAGELESADAVIDPSITAKSVPQDVAQFASYSSVPESGSVDESLPKAEEPEPALTKSSHLGQE